jgi:recombination associated protein RdgC
VRHPEHEKESGPLGVTRGALTFTRLFVQGKPPKDLRKRYLEAVKLRKFQPLAAEDEASEAVGWCVIERPFDLDFQSDRVFYDRFLMLGLRVDKWRIPGVLLKSQVADEEQRMLSRAGREKLTRAEKEDIKLRVIGRLRKKILPTSRAFDVLWDLDAGTVLLFTHAARTTEEFAALFQKTFGLELHADSPYAAAQRAALPPPLQRAFDAVEPLRLSSSRRAKAAGGAEAPAPSPPVRALETSEDEDEDEVDEELQALIERIETTRFLGAEMLLWVWLRQELLNEPIALGEAGQAEVWLDRKLTLEHVLDRTERVAVRGAQPSGSAEAREAVRNMKVPVQARLVLRLAEQDFAFDFNAPRFLLGSGAIPAVLKEEGDDAFLERVELIRRLTELLDRLFAAFLRERLVPGWSKGWEPALAAWMDDESVPASALRELAAVTRAAKRSA